MTQPALAVPVRRLGRHYPHPPVDLSHLPRKWDTIDPADVPATISLHPSVTNILDVLDKPALRGWYAEQSLISAYDDWIVHGDDALSDRAQFIKRHKWAGNKKRDARADAGTSAHTIAERLTSDEALPKVLSEADEMFADAFMAFWSDFDPEPVWVEQTVVHPEVGYAGTADLFANVKHDDEPVLTVIDYKTRAGEPDDKKIRKYGLAYDSNILQLAALGSATFRYVLKGDGWACEPLPLVRRGLVVVLFEDGQYRHQWVPPEQMESGFEAFSALRVAWAWRSGL